MNRYKVLKARFVFAGREYKRGQVLQSQDSALIRRAVRDQDLELVSGRSEGKPRKGA